MGSFVHIHLSVCSCVSVYSCIVCSHVKLCAFLYVTFKAIGQCSCVCEFSHICVGMYPCMAICM